MEGCGDKIFISIFPSIQKYWAKIVKATFVQQIDEPLCEVWEKYKVLLRKCPNHGFEGEI